MGPLCHVLSFIFVTQFCHFLSSNNIDYYFLHIFWHFWHFNIFRMSHDIMMMHARVINMMTCLWQHDLHFFFCTFHEIIFSEDVMFMKREQLRVITFTWHIVIMLWTTWTLWCAHFRMCWWHMTSMMSWCCVDNICAWHLWSRFHFHFIWFYLHVWLCDLQSASRNV